MPDTRYLKARHGIEILHDDGKTQILSGVIVPSEAGVPANVGSIYLCTNGKHYKKTGTNDTHWSPSIPEAPSDGKLYGRRNSTWLDIDLSTGSSAAGNEGNVQFNEDDLFSADPDFNYNKSEKQLTVSGIFIKPEGDKVGLWVL